MRIVAAEVSHETNTFSVVPTDLAAFERAGIHRGEQIVRHLANTATPFAGFLDVAETHGFELVPLLSVWATPSGMVSGDALGTLVDEIIAGIQAHAPYDGILLGLEPRGGA